MQPYHEAWLTAHPHRTREWLADRLRDGFDVHHLDGNHDNNDPANLVLIEHTDHMMLHGGRMLGRLGPPNGPNRPRKKRRAGARTITLPDGRRILAFSGETKRTATARFINDPSAQSFRLQP